MLKTLCCIVALGFCAPQGKEVKNPDIAIKADLGMAFRKPPKNDEWDFKEKGGFFNNSALVVSHKVDTITIEIVYQEKATNGGYDIKEAGNNQFKALSGNASIVDAKKISTTPQKLPGGGGGNQNASFLHMTFKQAERPMELRMWVFIGKNQNLYSVFMTNEDAMYKKHQKVADYILSSIEIFKPAK